MSVQYTRFYDQMQGLIDSINHDSDPAHRLTNLQRLYKDGLTLILQSRDEAAYELRTRYSGADAASISGIDRKFIDYWAHRWRKRNNLPPLKRKKRIDLSSVLDLSGE